MHHLVQEGRKQRDQRFRTHQSQSQSPTSEPTNVEETPATVQFQEESAGPTMSGMNNNFPRILPQPPPPVVKSEALAAIDEGLREIPIDFILDDILTNLACMYVYDSSNRLSTKS